jgi:hypothetical protein
MLHMLPGASMYNGAKRSIGKMIACQFCKQMIQYRRGQQVMSLLGASRVGVGSVKNRHNVRIIG